MAKVTPSIESYKKLGLVQLSTWVKPETMRKIKMLAFVEDKTIREIVEARFNDVSVDIKEDTKNSVVIRFSRELEESH